MVKVEIMFKCSREVFIRGDVDEIETVYEKEFYLKNLQKVADYLVDDLYNDINEYLDEKDNSYFDFKQYPDEEQGFAYMCEIMTVKIDGKVLKSNDYNKIMEEPFEN